MDERELLASVYCPPAAKAPWLVEELLAPASVRYYGLARTALADALRAARLERGAKVLLPGFVCVEAASAVAAAGCEPVFLETGPGTLPVEPEDRWPRSEAAIAVNTFGFPQDLAPFSRYAQRTGAWLIEDNAHGLFSRAPEGTRLGLRADAGVFSLRKTITLASGAALAIPPGSRFPLPAQGAFQSGAPARFRVKQALRAAARVFGAGPLRSLHKLARSGSGGGAGAGDAAAPALLAGPIRLADPALEVERRRELYRWCDARLAPLGAAPVFAGLPDGTSPYGYAFRAPQEALGRIEASLDEAGLDSFPWPELPPAVAAAAPAHYLDVRCVRFLW